MLTGVKNAAGQELDRKQVSRFVLTCETLLMSSHWSITEVLMAMRHQTACIVTARRLQVGP